MSKQSIDVIVPIHNEEECLHELIDRLRALRSRIAYKFELSVILVDDGSTDSSRSIIEASRSNFPWLVPVYLTRNFGHQIAVTAGMDVSASDFVAIIDGDLQDPPELIPEMIQQLSERRCEIVYGQRIHREGETWFKLATAHLFYRALKRASGLDIPIDSGDFRVMTKKANQTITELREHNRYLRGLATWTGLRASKFPYVRESRYAGTTKYSIGKMFTLAFNGIVSFSATPLRLIQMVGLLLVITGVFAAITVVVASFFSQLPTIDLIVLALFLTNTGMVLGAVGLVGGYVHRIQDEVRNRPLYLKDDKQ